MHTSFHSHISPSSEHSLLDKIKQYSHFTPSSLYPVGIGDDAAVRSSKSGEQIILTTDTCVQDVHFSFTFMTLAEAGYKAMVTNLSDCASMGAIPESVLVNLVFPRKVVDGNRQILELYKGFNRACKKWNFPIVGGDLSGGPCWMMAITLLGRMAPKSKPLLRSGGKEGDRLWVTGVLGQSAAGLSALQRWGRENVPTSYRSLVRSHIQPVPRIEAGILLAGNDHIHAVMDLSDGISKDAATLGYESGMGVVLDSAALAPIDSMKKLAEQLKANPADWVLHGGEDYELLIAVDNQFDLAGYLKPAKVKCRPIGILDKTRNGLWIADSDRIETVECHSWDHFKG